jgi:hypothetical protein
LIGFLCKVELGRTWQRPGRKAAVAFSWPGRWLDYESLACMSPNVSCITSGLPSLEESALPLKAFKIHQKLAKMLLFFFLRNSIRTKLVRIE